MGIKKNLASLFLFGFLIGTVQAQSVLEIAGGLMQLLGLDVPVYDSDLTGLEDKYEKREKKNWDVWKGLYNDFVDVFRGRTRQLIERNLGFSLSNSASFESLIDNAHRFLENLETNPYYSYYLDESRLGKLRKRDGTNKLPDPDKPSEEKPEGGSPEFREMLLQPEAEKLLARNYFNGNEDIKARIDETIKQGQEKLLQTEGFLDLLTQVKRDEDDRIAAMVKKLDEVVKNSQGKKVQNKDADKEDRVADTAAALGTLISVAHDLSMVDESVHKMIKTNREKDLLQFLNQRKVVNLEKAREGGGKK